jgi:CBS domain-containing protein
MQAKDIMTAQVISVAPDASVQHIAQLMLRHHISALPVLNPDGQPVGIVREGDLIHRIETGTEHHPSWWLALLADPEQRTYDYVKTHGKRAEEVMTRIMVSVRPETPVDEVADMLEKHHLRSLPVLQEGKVVGMVSRADLLRGLATQPARPSAPITADDEAIRDRILRAIRSADLPNASLVSVSVKEGVAQLWGAVDSDEEKLAIGIAAENTPGVRAVENHLAQIPAWAWAE